MFSLQHFEAIVFGYVGVLLSNGSKSFQHVCSYHFRKALWMLCFHIQGAHTLTHTDTHTHTPSLKQHNYSQKLGFGLVLCVALLLDTYIFHYDSLLYCVITQLLLGLWVQVQGFSPCNLLLGVQHPKMQFCFLFLHEGCSKHCSLPWAFGFLRAFPTNPTPPTSLINGPQLKQTPCRAYNSASKLPAAGASCVLTFWFTSLEGA